jgi:putative CocE/NonD family hydrolase
MSRRLLCLLALALALPATASASVVERGYLPLKDGTMLGFTLTLPEAGKRFPVVLQYDPYAAGAASDPTWNDSGYAMLGVNMRGTGCSQGTFNMVRADIWGADGAEVVDWAAGQPWSTGSIGMLGYSFTGTSQLATAAYAGPALKAIMPGNVFPDLYRDISYPGGVYNALDPAWILAGRQFVVGTDSATKGATDPNCDANEAQQLAGNDSQTLDTTLHPYRDEYWSHDPYSLHPRVHVPMLGCVNWQDMTVYSRSFNEFRDDFDPQTTWLAGGDGAHGDCPISRARRVRFLDHYLKQARNGWEKTPRLHLVHEVDAAPGRDKVPENAGGWQSSFSTWADVDRAIEPVTLHLRAGRRLDLAPPGQPEPADSYLYDGSPGANKPELFPYPTAPGRSLSYTTPPLARDAEFLGSGSANLWIASTAGDTDLQVMLSEVRPDGQESYVANGWLQVSQRRLDERGSSALRPMHTNLEADVQPLSAEPVLARVEIQPFNHVFRAGSSIRFSIDVPSTSLVGKPGPATNTIHLAPATASAIVLGHLPGVRAPTPLPACAKLIAQPCRTVAGAVPGGSLTFPERSPAAQPRRLAKLVLGRPRLARGGRGLRLAVRAEDGAIGGVRAVLRDRGGRRVAASGPFTAGARARTVVFRLARRLRPGRYSLHVAARTADGRLVAASRRFTAR